MTVETRQKGTCRPNVVADDDNEHNNNCDHRQTIASPLSGERKTLELYLQQNQFDQSHSVLQTKPPLKPSSRRKYYTKSVCTKSTSSTTYVSSDSEEEDGSEGTHDGSYILSQKSSCSCSESTSIGARKPAGKVKSESTRSVALIPNNSSTLSTSFENPGRHVTSLVLTDSASADNLSREDDDYSVYNLTSDDSCGLTLEDDDDSVSDLDKLIKESSMRWKSNAEAVVSRTSTAAFLQGSSTLPSALSKIQSPNQMSVLGHVGLPVSSLAESIGLSQSSRFERLKSTDTEKLIEKQQAEISRLRGMLLARVNRDAQSSSLNSYVASVTNLNRFESRICETKRFSLPAAKEDVRSRDVAPFEHIEVRLMHAADDEVGSCCNWQDDLTLGSSFNVTGEREQRFETSISPRNSPNSFYNSGKSRSSSRRNCPLGSN